MLALLMLIVSACGNNAANNAGGSSESSGAEATASPSPEADAGTITYASETGDIEVPASPKRIIALTNAPNILSLEGAVVGVDEWTKKNPLFEGKLTDVETVAEDDLEKIIELEPDLIVAGSHNKNLEKLADIAPTVVYTWGKLDYLAQQLEIGKLLNKETEAQAWIDDFTARAKAAGEEIKAKIGADATISVFETDAKDFYVFGNNWARGTEILYQAMGLNMTDKVKTDALGPGYYTLSLETVPDYAGDYIVLSRSSAADNSYMETETWKNIPAVKNGHVIELDTESVTYSDPISLEYMLDIFKEGLLK
jgi:iron complex transport system substrate-binding protein